MNMFASGSAVSRVDQLKAQPRNPGEASFFYRDHHFQYDAVKVLPGEYFVSTEDLVIMTVLGSCISACIWDGKVRAGGMNHFMLPDGDNGDGFGRYGSYAMELLLNEMIKMGADYNGLFTQHRIGSPDKSDHIASLTIRKMLCVHPYRHHLFCIE